MDANLINRINEHKELTARIAELASFIEACKVDMIKGECKVDVEDYVLLNVQLEHMCHYHEVLESRLNKHGIYVDNGEYFEKVNTEYRTPVNSNPFPGSDHDLDGQNHE